MLDLLNSLHEQMAALLRAVRASGPGDSRQLLRQFLDIHQRMLFSRVRDAAMLQDMPDAAGAGLCAFYRELQAMSNSIENFERGMAKRTLLEGLERMAEAGMWTEALGLCEGILSRFPEDPDYHAYLHRMAALCPDIAPRWTASSRRRHIKYGGQFGHSKLNYPVSLCHLPENGLLAVSNLHSHEVSFFTPGGQYAGRLPLELKTPSGVCAGPGGTFFVCDSDRGVVIPCNPEGQAGEEITVAELFPEQAPEAKALLFCTWCDDRLYVCAQDSDNGRILSTDIRTGKAGGERTDYPPLAKSHFGGIRAENGTLLLGAFQEGEIFAFDCSLRQWTRKHVCPYSPCYDFLLTQDAIYMNTEQGLCKSGLDDESLYISKRHLFNASTSTRCLPYAMAYLPSEHWDTIFITDFYGGFIHVLHVAPPEPNAQTSRESLHGRQPQ